MAVKIRGPVESRPIAYSYTRYPEGWCMEYVWKCLSAPVKLGLADANAGWNRSTQRHSDRNAPLGSCVYFGGGKHGHVGYGIGGGWLRSTDWPKKGQVGDVSIAQLAASWRIPYFGWTGDFAGHQIPGLGFNPANLRLGKASAEARMFNPAVWTYVQRHEPTWARANRAAWNLESAGVFGVMTQRAMRQGYASLHRRNPKAWPKSLTVSPAPDYPGPAFLREIGVP